MMQKYYTLKKKLLIMIMANITTPESNNLTAENFKARYPPVLLWARCYIVSDKYNFLMFDLTSQLFEYFPSVTRNFFRA